MNKQQKIEYMNMDTIGTCWDAGGIEVKEIEHGINDYVIFVACVMGSNPTVHRIKIQYNSVNAYFKFNGWHISFNNIIRN